MTTTSNENGPQSYNIQLYWEIRKIRINQISNAPEVQEHFEKKSSFWAFLYFFKSLEIIT